MTRVAHPQVRPATHEIVEENEALVATVTVTYPMDGSAIAAKLYAAYSKPFENGTPLPEELMVEDVMRTLAQESADCADGWHFWHAEPGQEAWDTVRPWAEAQTRRLFPTLTWDLRDCESRAL
ncbi:hypothetical protein [Streptomyces sp. NPDC002553]|uniref:hypothetical protein n=1 Tax=Streptomyces sp. NPDC002553 TaxID=3154417 RepID=UPI00331B0201